MADEVDERVPHVHPVLEVHREIHEVVEALEPMRVQQLEQCVRGVPVRDVPEHHRGRMPRRGLPLAARGRRVAGTPACGRGPSVLGAADVLGQAQARTALPLLLSLLLLLRTPAASLRLLPVWAALHLELLWNSARVSAGVRAGVARPHGRVRRGPHVRSRHAPWADGAARRAGPPGWPAGRHVHHPTAVRRHHELLMGVPTVVCRG
mmetsp:Transcript_67283/g.189566  ORF Transcript_67283/g.189566 Transcript_67283/m.189566 type:complete len:207 (+) Transcript_67283:147-767(+)